MQFQWVKPTQLPKDTVLYLSGPMSGFQHYNFDAFNQAAADLRSRGYKVINPAEYGADPLKMYKEYLQRDLQTLLTEATHVVVLPGWQESKGAQVEVHAAKACGIPVLAYPSLDLWDETVSILDEAKRLVTGERMQAYGPPENDFARTAMMLTGLFRDRGYVFSADEIPLIMIAVKLSRQINTPTMDNLIDICGYAACTHRVIQKLATAHREFMGGITPDDDDDIYEANVS